MSFKSLNVEDLRVVAQKDLDLDGIDESSTKAQILAAILEKNITWDAAVELSSTLQRVDSILKEKQANVVTTKTLKKEEKPVAPVVEDQQQGVLVAEQKDGPAKVLVKMNRENPRFDIRGYRFTYDHPYALVTEDDAEYLVTQQDGFSYATPREAAEFYG